jgi:hypothetical protein
MPAAVTGFYARSVGAISFHHIEDVIRAHGLKVSIVAFVNETSDESVANLADSVFGTRFACVGASGLWAGIRVIDTEPATAFVVLYFKGDRDHQRDQLTAFWRGATVLSLCTQRLIGTFRFYVDWARIQPPDRRKTYLGNDEERKLGPEFVICLFLPKGRHDFRTAAVINHKKSLNIPGTITQVPFRDDWSAPTLDDVLAEVDLEDPSAPANDFVSQWQNVLASQTVPGCRPSYDTEPGLQYLKEIVATYLTLREFRDLPTQTVLRYCNLPTQQVL